MSAQSADDRGVADSSNAAATPADHRTLSPATQLAWLAAIVMAYLLLAISWARVTPAWENPDEPAHWNYVVHLASSLSLPILRPGDDAQQLVDRLKSQHFPAGSDISAIRYESHQPPLYYALAAGVYHLTNNLPLKQQLDAVRGLSIIFGAALIVLAWRFVRLLLREEPALALASAAFVAFVPMHINVTAAVDNDTLGDALLAAVVVLLVQWLQFGQSRRGSVALGVLVGLAALTKITTLVAFPLVALAAALHWLQHRKSVGVGRDLRSLVIVYSTALVVWGWWVIRNIVTYGLADPLALGINQKVVAQPLTGPLNQAAVARFGSITFDSFWAQFGWMGIPVPQVYPALTLLCLLALLGLGAALVRALRNGLTDEVRQKAPVMVLAAAWPGLVFLADAQYNLTFIQAQGRYLFPAIGGFGLFFMLGLSRLAGPRLAGVTVALASLLMLTLSVVLLKAVVIPAWQ